MRNPLIVGNWKMNGCKDFVANQLRLLLAGNCAASLVIMPPAPYLALIEELLTGSSLKWGGQDVSQYEVGAYTGQISADMLKEFGADFVLVGHSERRQLNHESNQEIAAKFSAAKKSGLTPILCVGETLDEREQGSTESVLNEQIKAVLELLGQDAFFNAVLAYEPVWAIGTGQAATPEIVETVHAYCRSVIGEYNPRLAEQLPILYGGSVKPENAKELLGLENVDGALVGGASLNAELFLKIAQTVELY